MIEVGEVAEAMVSGRQQRKDAQQQRDVIQNYKVLGSMKDHHSYQAQNIRHLGAEVDTRVAEEQAGDNGLEVVEYTMAAGCTVLAAQVLVGCNLAVAGEVVCSPMEGAEVQRRRVGFEGGEPCHCYSHRNH